MSLYKTAFDIINQKTLETGLYNFCCLCFNRIEEDDEVTLVEDQVVFESYGGFSTREVSNILTELMGINVLRIMAVFKSLCTTCSKLALNSYKFIQSCKERAVQLETAIDNITDCFENTTDCLNNYKTMFVSIDTEELTFEQFYDHRRQRKDSALSRFQDLANGRRTGSNNKYVDETKEKKEKKFRDFSTMFIKTHELKLDPDSPDFTCKICKKTYPVSGSLRLHFFSAHFKKEFPCSSCSKSFGTAGLLHTHERESHSTVTCDECGKKLLNRTSTLKRHKLTHQSKLAKVCDRCGRNYKKTKDFYRHMEQNTCEVPSRMPGNYVCDHCGKKCHYKHQLKAHIKYEHENAEGFVCKWCGRKCYNNSALKTHILKHTGEKNFVCAICGGKFVTRQSLINHTRLHTGERPYPCQFCKQSFLSASRRSEHIERNHNDAAFECDLCDASYNARRSLQKHRKGHFAHD